MQLDFCSDTGILQKRLNFTSEKTGETPCCGVGGGTHQAPLFSEDLYTVQGGTFFFSSVATGKLRTLS